ncbi:MAG: elongation factor P maturation arginine rhamnosyltransferase EarP [Gallionellaceae bacterium]|nr:MAG: elongation factor P maturation arginine rhamnosyltransferase EarP [Gallionellaceae bacterium]
MTPAINSHPQTCDIFCAVVDNYGDIGVSWRLARQLVHEHGIHVRLWVDDLCSFGKLCPEVDAALDKQHCRGVEVRRWGASFSWQSLSRPGGHPLKKQLANRLGGKAAAGEGLGERVVAELVIEAFACKLPEAYIEAMAAQERKPVWLNLEYLSAEDWVEGAHKLPSPHLRLPLEKYFFFPGFTAKTGGLLLERELLQRRDVFQADIAKQQAYWHGLNLPERSAGELRISLFSYENAAVASLLRAWEQGAMRVVCCVPEGRVLPQVAAFFGLSSGKAGDAWQRGNLHVQALPFVEQERYDELLWACDINFVRGEDSCVRAQWAGKPFIWHIYPQHDGVHMHKLRALSGLYGAGLPAAAHQANEALWLAWNGEGDIAGAWQAFAAQRLELERHARAWSAELADNNLALNLLAFSRQVA